MPAWVRPVPAPAAASAPLAPPAAGGKAWREPLVDLRWKHKLLSLDQTSGTGDDVATLTVETPDGIFKLEADWVIAADGANSDTRRMIGADFTGHFFQDRFLIADVVMKADFPTERWFWFDPPFHRNQSVLLHKQSNNVWRIDFQLGWDADPEEEKKPEKVIPRLQAMLGDDRPFELEWVSIYTFQCRRMTDFRHGRVLFVGDAAHQVSPFGARGANSGFQDADDLMWKLALVIQGQAPEKLLDTYALDRQFAADENIMNSTRSTDFITPKSRTSKTFRNQVLALASKLQAPVMHTFRGKDLVAYDHPHWIGGVGLIGGAPGTDALHGAEVMLMLGSDYPYSEFLPTQSKIIQVDERGFVLGRRAPVTLGITGSVGPSVQALLEKVEGKTDGSFLQKANADRERWNSKLDNAAEIKRHHKKIKPQSVARALSDLADDDARFVIDTGVVTLWCGNWIRQRGKQRLLASFMPQDKVDAVRAERADGVTVMVGDGLNDAPALAAVRRAWI